MPCVLKRHLDLVNTEQAHNDSLDFFRSNSLVSPSKRVEKRPKYRMRMKREYGTHFIIASSVCMAFNFLFLFLNEHFSERESVCWSNYCWLYSQLFVYGLSHAFFYWFFLFCHFLYIHSINTPKTMNVGTFLVKHSIRMRFFRK